MSVSTCGGLFKGCTLFIRRTTIDKLLLFQLVPRAGQTAASTGKAEKRGQSAPVGLLAVGQRPAGTLLPVATLELMLLFTALFVTGNLRNIASVFGYHRLAQHRIVVTVVTVVMVVQIFGLFVTASG